MEFITKIVFSFARPSEFLLWKIKLPPREAQLDLFTGKQEQPIQARLFQDFVKGGAKSAEKTPGKVQKPKTGAIQGAGRWVKTSHTGRTFETPSLVASNASQVASLFKEHTLGLPGLKVILQ